MSKRALDWLASERATRLLVRGTAVLMAVMVGLAALTVPRIVSNTEASRRTDALASCRARYQADVDKATVRLFDTFGDVQSGIAAGVVAAIRQDPTTLALVAAELNAAEKAKAAALIEMVDASTAYQAAVDLSQTDPDRFLEECDR